MTNITDKIYSRVTEHNLKIEERLRLLSFDLKDTKNQILVLFMKEISLVNTLLYKIVFYGAFLWLFTFLLMLKLTS